ncbi:MAG: COG4705 family protein [Solirubrobacteraceae bacterium]
MKSPSRQEYLHTKVPEITPWFWASKIVMTATGEAISDAMNQQLGPAIAVPIMVILMGFTLRWQLRQDRYRTLPYWSVVAAISIFGTSSADAFHVGLGWSYEVTTGMFAVILAIVFISWHRSEGTLDIHSIFSRRRERFYWLTVLATFALGTALGDFTATILHLGYLPSFLLFGGIILIPLVLRYRFSVDAVFCFWFAYTITRPLGASWADYSDMPIHQAGLNLGQIPTAIYLGIISIGLVGYMWAKQVGCRQVATAGVVPILAAEAD